MWSDETADCKKVKEFTIHISFCYNCFFIACEKLHTAEA